MNNDTDYTWPALPDLRASQYAVPLATPVREYAFSALLDLLVLAPVLIPLIMALTGV